MMTSWWSYIIVATTFPGIVLAAIDRDITELFGWLTAMILSFRLIFTERSHRRTSDLLNQIHLARMKSETALMELREKYTRAVLRRKPKSRWMV